MHYVVEHSFHPTPEMFSLMWLLRKNYLYIYSAVTIANVFLPFIDPSRDEQIETNVFVLVQSSPKVWFVLNMNLVVHVTQTRSCGYHCCT